MLKLAKNCFSVLLIAWHGPQASQIVCLVDHAYRPHLLQTMCFVNNWLYTCCCCSSARVCALENSSSDTVYTYWGGGRVTKFNVFPQKFGLIIATAHANGTIVLLNIEYTEVGQTSKHVVMSVTHSSQTRKVVQRDDWRVIHICDMVHQRCVPETVLLK